METYPIIIDGALAGKLTVERQGPRTAFDAVCAMQPGLLRISVYGGGREGYLGLLAPEGERLTLHRVFSRSQLRDFPREIERVNRELMLVTMEHCYDTMQENTDDIEELEEWIRNIRIELKKNLIRKQEKEAKNHEIYSYMHDIFGPDVVNLFDLRYNPEQQHPQKNPTGTGAQGTGNTEPPANP